MTQVRSGWLAATFVLLVPTASVRAQTPITAFLPEIDSYFRLSSNVRLVFDAKGYMEDGDLNHAQIGPSLQFNIRPLEKLKRMTIFDLDDIKCMPVVLTFGYRYLPSTVQPAINRVQPIVLFHVPFPGRTLVTDRNRADLDWSAGAVSLDLSQSHHSRATPNDSRLPSGGLRRRRIRLPKPVLQMEHHPILRRVSLACKQTPPA